MIDKKNLLVLNFDNKLDMIKIKSCKIPTMWYNDFVGESFVVTYETDSAVWVKVENNNNAWVYKSDIE